MRWKLQLVQEGERELVEFGRSVPRFEEELHALQVVTPTLTLALALTLTLTLALTLTLTPTLTLAL
jgi:hypothetical protein